VRRIIELIDELEGRIHNKHLVISRVNGSIDELPEQTRKEMEKLPYEPEGLIPFDEELVGLDLKGQPLLKIPTDAQAYVAVKRLLQTIGVLN
jgi:CO dehydrogenase maturation factor